MSKEYQPNLRDTTHKINGNVVFCLWHLLLPTDKRATLPWFSFICSSGSSHGIPIDTVFSNKQKITYPFRSRPTYAKLISLLRLSFPLLIRNDIVFDSTDAAIQNECMLHTIRPAFLVPKLTIHIGPKLYRVIHEFENPKRIWLAFFMPKSYTHLKFSVPLSSRSECDTLSFLVEPIYNHPTRIYHHFQRLK